MAINFSGEFTTPRSQEEVFDFLSDPNRFAPLLPDFQSMNQQDPTHFTVKVKVGVGNIRGSAEIKMELAEAVKPQRAQYKGQGSAVGSQVTVSAGFDLSANGDGTKVLWQGETSVFGKLASMAGGMLEPLGRKNIQKLIDGLQKALAEPVTARAPAAPGAALESPPSPPENHVGAVQRMPDPAVEAASFNAVSAAAPQWISVPGEPHPTSASGTSDQADPQESHGDDNA